MERYSERYIDEKLHDIGYIVLSVILAIVYVFAMILNALAGGLGDTGKQSHTVGCSCNGFLLLKGKCLWVPMGDRKVQLGGRN